MPENDVPAGDMPGPDDPRRSGVLLVDKPAGMTSHDVVSRIRRLASTRKVGHAGTLDPMATGLLVLGLNSSTRLLTFLVGLDKTYLATIRLGAATTTDDAEGEPLTRAAPGAVAAVTPEAIRQQMAQLTGAIRQVPSSVSAIKIGGRRAYALVRAGERVELPAREVTVSRFELLEAPASPGQRGDGWLDLDVLVECSSGTYVRALARDLGAALGVGGHLTALRRTRIGPFQVTDAAPLDTLDVASALQRPAVVATRLFPSVQLDAGAVRDLMHGKRVPIDVAEPYSEPHRGPVAALGPDGRLVGLLETLPGGLAKPLVNFPRDEVLE